MRFLGKTAKRVRLSLGMSQVAMAKALEISVVQLSKIENDRSMPSPTLIAKYREVANVDLYVVDWCDDPDLMSLPPSVRAAAEQLKKAWSKAIGIS